MQNPYFFPGYPIYNPTIPQSMPQSMPQQNLQPSNQSIQRKVDFVQGRTSADVYNVEAGQEVVLIDMDNPLVYRKSRGFDNILQPMEIFDLVPHKDESKVDTSNFVTADQLEDALESFENTIKEEVDKRISESVSSKKAPVKRGD